ncbi:hypothetical protein D3C87_76610 [compost metagenome]
MKYYEVSECIDAMSVSISLLCKSNSGKYDIPNVNKKFMDEAYFYNIELSNLKYEFGFELFKDEIINVYLCVAKKSKEAKYYWNELFDFNDPNREQFDLVIKEFLSKI